MQDYFPAEHVFTRELVARGKPPPESRVKSLSVMLLEEGDCFQS